MPIIEHPKPRTLWQDKDERYGIRVVEVIDVVGEVPLVRYRTKTIDDLVPNQTPRTQSKLTSFVKRFTAVPKTS